MVKNIIIQTNRQDIIRKEIVSMKRMIIFVVAIVILLLAAASWAANTEKDKAAVTVADKWLMLIDTGKYSESWKEANEYFRKSITQDQWEKTVRSVKINTGKVISRKLKNKIDKKPLPSEPRGKYLIIQYATSFQNRKSVTEEVAVMLEKNGRWKVSGYHLF
jgi:hypothetical protein